MTCKKQHILILGTTASGKGQLAFDLAQKLGGEIISIDSMKVYQRMNIGTAKPPRDARQHVKYHLMDVVEPSDYFSVGTFLKLAYDAIEQITSRNKPIIAVGGTAMYIKALLYGLFEGPGTDNRIREKLWHQAQIQGLDQLYQQLSQIDPVASERIHPNDRKRIIRALEVYEITGKTISSLQQQFDAAKTMYNWTVIGLRRQKADANFRINKRVKKMLAAGLIDEVKGLLTEDKPLSQQARCAIGYAEIIDYLNGKMNLEDSTELIKKNTRRLAKHQRTWFRRFKNVNWLDIEAGEPTDKLLTQTKALLDNIT